MILSTRTFICISLMMISVCSARAQQIEPSTWLPWKYLIGDWIMDTQPNEGSTTFSFALTSSGQTLVRTNRTESPAARNKPAYTHLDTLWVNVNANGLADKAVYHDNEGHRLNYLITYPENSIILTAEAEKNAPKFRLRYTRKDDKHVHLRFEYCAPGQIDFTTYLETSAHKTG